MEWNKLNKLENELKVISQGRLVPPQVIEVINLLALSMLDDRALTQNEILESMAPSQSNLNSLSISNLGNNTTKFNFIDQLCNHYQYLERVTYAEYTKKFKIDIKEPGKSYLYWPSAKGIESWLLLLGLPWEEFGLFMIKFQGDKQLAKSIPLKAMSIKHECILALLTSKNNASLSRIIKHHQMLCSTFDRQQFKNKDLMEYVTSKKYQQRRELFKSYLREIIDSLYFLGLNKYRAIKDTEKSIRKKMFKNVKSDSIEQNIVAIKNLKDLLER